MSEPEKPETKTGKRIVSKGEYALSAIRKFVFGFGSVGFAILSLVCFLTFLLLFVGSIKFLISSHFQMTDIALLPLTLAMITGSVGGYFRRLAVAGIERVRQENVVPLTRANAANLPAPESLVRASKQPLQAQQTVLLRAATQASETHAEQLVRPAGGQE